MKSSQPLTLSSRPQIADEPPEEVEEQIRQRAYQLYYERGAEDGHDVDDWLQAEREVRNKTKAIAA